MRPGLFGLEVASEFATFATFSPLKGAMTLTTIIITLLTFTLIIIALFMMLVILMQRPNTNAGMGAAFGGGVTEQTFGAETTNVLTRATKWSAVAFFAISLSLYLIYLSNAEEPAPVEDDLSAVVSGLETEAAAQSAAPVAEAPEAAPAETDAVLPTPPAEEETPVPAPGS